MIHLDVGADNERVWRNNARLLGQDLESYLGRILELGSGALPVSDPAPALFDEALSELAAGIPVHSSLPANFSRADLYTDHD